MQGSALPCQVGVVIIDLIVFADQPCRTEHFKFFRSVKCITNILGMDPVHSSGFGADNLASWLDAQIFTAYALDRHSQVVIAVAAMLVRRAPAIIELVFDLQTLGSHDLSP